MLNRMYKIATQEERSYKVENGVATKMAKKSTYHREDSSHLFHGDTKYYPLRYYYKHSSLSLLCIPSLDMI